MKGNLIITSDTAQAFERSIDMMETCIKEMRRVAYNMMPEVLVESGLNIALKDYCNNINQSGALNLNYYSIGIDDSNIDQTTSIAIYRIVQELINNSIKHAAAKKAIVQVTQSEDLLSLTVEDDGIGFDTKTINEGIGIQNMQQRIKSLHGKININSIQKNSTCINISIPI